MNVETLTGTIGRRKKGGFFRKIGEAFKKGAKAVFRGAAKLNPVLVPARAAFLAMVRNNTGGVAKKLQQAGIAKARKKWENLGGNFDKLQEAVQKGAGAKIQGIGSLQPDPELSAMLAAMQSAQGRSIEGIGAVPGFMAILEAAKPILNAILSALGIRLGQPDAGGAVSPEEAQLAAQVEALPPSDITQKITDAVNDPGTPGGGGGGGAGGGVPWVPLAIGGAVLLMLTMTNKGKR